MTRGSDRKASRRALWALPALALWSSPRSTQAAAPLGADISAIDTIYESGFLARAVSRQDPALIVMVGGGPYTFVLDDAKKSEFKALRRNMVGLSDGVRFYVSDQLTVGGWMGWSARASPAATTSSRQSAVRWKPNVRLPSWRPNVNALAFCSIGRRKP